MMGHSASIYSTPSSANPTPPSLPSDVLRQLATNAPELHHLMEDDHPSTTKLQHWSELFEEPFESLSTSPTIVLNAAEVSTLVTVNMQSLAKVYFHILNPLTPWSVGRKRQWIETIRHISVHYANFTVTDASVHFHPFEPKYHTIANDLGIRVRNGWPLIQITPCDFLRLMGFGISLEAMPWIHPFAPRKPPLLYVPFGALPTDLPIVPYETNVEVVDHRIVALTAMLPTMHSLATLAAIPGPYPEGAYVAMLTTTEGSTAPPKVWMDNTFLHVHEVVAFLHKCFAYRDHLLVRVPILSRNWMWVRKVDGSWSIELLQQAFPVTMSMRDLVSRSVQTIPPEAWIRVEHRMYLRLIDLINS